MNKKTIGTILKNTDYVRTSGSPEEKQAAGYLQSLCESMGISVFQESFDVGTAEIITASLSADGREIPCTGTSLRIGNGIMVVFRQVIAEVLGNRLQLVILQIWYELLRP